MESKPLTLGKLRRTVIELGKFVNEDLRPYLAVFKYHIVPGSNFTCTLLYKYPMEGSKTKDGNLVSQKNGRFYSIYHSTTRPLNEICPDVTKNSAATAQLAQVVQTWMAFEIIHVQRGQYVLKRRRNRRDPGDIAFFKAAALIQGPNMHVATCSEPYTAAFSVPIETPVQTHTLWFYQQWAKVTGDSAPLDALTGSFISVGSNAGAIQVLYSMVNSRPNLTDLNEDLGPATSEKPAWLFGAIARAIGKLLDELDFTDAPKLDPPSWHREELLRVKVPHGTAGGVVFSASTGDQDGVYYGRNFKKAELHSREASRLSAIYELVKIYLLTGRESLIDGPGPEALFHPFPIKMSQKSEVRAAGADPEKVRIIFVVAFMLIILDKYQLAPVMEYIKQRGPFVIGFSWWHGGMHELAHALGATAPIPENPGDRLFYFDLDISKLDQSLKAGMLALFRMLLMAFYKYDLKDADSVANMMFAAWSGDNTATHFVHWPDDLWRLIIGIMPSGIFTTAIINTMCVVISLYVFIEYAALQMAKVDKNLANQFLHDRPTIKVGGDDVAGSARQKYRNWFNLQEYAKFAKAAFDFTVKMTDSGEYEQFDTIFENDRPVLVEDRYHRFRPTGIVFFKYRARAVTFVEDGESYSTWLPWRDENELFIKLGRFTETTPTPLVEIMKTRALAAATYGTNPKFYNFALAYDDFLCRRYKETAKALADGAEDDLSPSEEVARDLENLRRKLTLQDDLFWKRLFSGIPTVDEIRDAALYDPLRWGKKYDDVRERKLLPPSYFLGDLSTSFVRLMDIGGQTDHLYNLDGQGITAAMEKDLQELSVNRARESQNVSDLV